MKTHLVDSTIIIANHHFHIDNGGHTFKIDNYGNVQISTGFFGYSDLDLNLGCLTAKDLRTISQLFNDASILVQEREDWCNGIGK
jgi:hypothetical protein